MKTLKRNLAKEAREIVRMADVCHAAVCGAKTDWKAFDKAEQLVVNMLLALNDTACETYQRDPKAANSLVGRTFAEGVADGYAQYVVVRSTKTFFQVEHVPLGDAWHARFVGDLGGKLPIVMAGRLDKHSKDALFGRSRSPAMTLEEFKAWEKTL